MIATNPFILLTSGVCSLIRNWTRMHHNIHTLNTVGRIVDGAMASEIGFSDEGLIDWCDKDMEVWKSDATMFISEGANAMGYATRFFRRVVIPMCAAQTLLRTGNDLVENAKVALKLVKGMSDSVWKQAAEKYLTLLYKELEKPRNERPATVSPELPADIHTFVTGGGTGQP